ncbi:hypothetical protein RHECNPAF_1740035 [Rhizobium etli CNPAF512]|nr:hypothetical protein RHECNPAF_1740035 [Rhizobium etli CNPAF512]
MTRRLPATGRACGGDRRNRKSRELELREIGRGSKPSSVAAISGICRQKARAATIPARGSTRQQRQRRHRLQQALRRAAEDHLPQP